MVAVACWECVDDPCGGLCRDEVMKIPPNRVISPLGYLPDPPTGRRSPQPLLLSFLFYLIFYFFIF
jgi:hypothetical protein